MRKSLLLGFAGLAEKSEQSWPGFTNKLALTFCYSKAHFQQFPGNPNMRCFTINDEC